MAAYNGRIADVVLERVNIVDLISQYTQLKRMGRNYKSLCPFHSEKTPSFVVTEDRQRYHCFGCGASGDAISFVMATENLDFLDAVEYLAERYGIDLSSHRKEKVSGDRRKVLLDINREAAIIFYKNLKKSEKAQAYLQQRSIGQEVAKQFGIGYALDAWDTLVRQMGSSKLKIMEEAGLVLKRKTGDGYYDQFRDRLIFPIFNVQGKVVGFGGRVFGDGLPKYLNSPDTDVFNKSSILYGLNFAKNWSESRQRMVVVEGYMDVIQLHQSGFKGAVATLGTALTKQHGDALSRYTEEVVVCYDGDNAGIKAALRSIDVLKNTKARFKILTLPNGLDPDEFINQNGLEAFIKLLDKAQSALDYQLSYLIKQFDPNSEDGRIAIVRAFVETLHNLENSVEKDIYVKKVANLVNVTEGAVRDQMNKVKSPIKHASSMTEEHEQVMPVMDNASRLNREVKKSEKKDSKGPLYQVELRLLEICLDGKTGYEMLCKVMDLEQFMVQGIRNTMVMLGEHYVEYDHFTPEAATDVMELDSVLKLQELIKNMVPISDIAKEIEINVIRHNEMILNIELKSVREERQRMIANKDNMNFGYSESKLAELMNKEMELTRMKSKIRLGLDYSRGGKSIE